jgi:phage-related minor tail protein
MAKGNMVLTLVAQTSKWASGLKKASGDALTFGKLVRNAMSAVAGAFLAVAGAIIMFLPNFIKMGEEARKSERRLENIAKQMGLFGENTAKVTQRLSEYAEAISYATGVDDELVRSAEAILLTFKNLAKTADTTGGAFDRATLAAVDLAAAGFGEVETNAKQLGKALQDPIKGLTALRKAGVTFTKAEQDKIRALVESNRLLEAQELILSAIETQVGGTAAATASATDRMSARFENLLETLSLALLPAVDELATAFSTWMDSKEGKDAVNDLKNALIGFTNWVASPSGKKAIDELGQSIKAIGIFARDTYRFLKDVKKVLDDISAFNASIFGGLEMSGTVITGFKPAKAPTSPSTSKSPVTVNVTGITPSVTVGRTVMKAVQDAQRLGMR